ncbi:hypothetical protein QN360_19250, partial [Glaciimonas sp. CA11.2]|uniref:hypothetical protein n=1 Tax=Glaciimonas sp. CA11.2 TaxID=3048601 RepID=UPI002B23E253
AVISNGTKQVIPHQRISFLVQRPGFYPSRFGLQQGLNQARIIFLLLMHEAPPQWFVFLKIADAIAMCVNKVHVRV